MAKIPIKVPKPPKSIFSKIAGFLILIRNLLIIIVVFSFLLNIYGIWQETGQIEPIVKEVGGQIFNPLYNLEQHTLKISTEGLINFEEEGLFQGYWIFLKNIWLFLEPLVIVFLWFSVYRRIFEFFLGDITPKFYIYGLSIIFFIITQWFYIILFTDLSMLAPFTSLNNVLKYLIGFFE